MTRKLFKVLKAVSRFVRRFWATGSVRILFGLNGIRGGRRLRAIGIPSVNVSLGGRAEIGECLTIRTGLHDTEVGMVGSRIRVGPKGMLKIGDRVGMSNVTIVCECSELDAAETPGDYLVEGTYTFTATTAIDKRGKTRPVVGYTIRTWNGSAWGAPVTHKGTSYTYTGGASPAKVKLKWNLRSDCMVFMIR